MAEVSGVSCKAMARACSRKWLGIDAGFQGKEGAIGVQSSLELQECRPTGKVTLLSSNEVSGAVSSSDSQHGWHGLSTAVKNHSMKASLRNEQWQGER